MTVNSDIERLIATGHLFRVNLGFTTTDAGILFTDDHSVDALRSILRASTSVDASYLRRVFAHPSAEIQNSEIPRVSAALRHVYDQRLRADAINHGQIPGALSASEALTVWKRMHGI